MARSRRELVFDAVVQALQRILTTNGFNTNLGLNVYRDVAPFNRVAQSLGAKLYVSFVREASPAQTQIQRRPRMTVALLLNHEMVVDEGSELDVFATMEPYVTDLQNALLQANDNDPKLGVDGVFNLDMDGWEPAIGSDDDDNAVEYLAEMFVNVEFEHDQTDVTTYQGVGDVGEE